MYFFAKCNRCGVGYVCLPDSRVCADCEKKKSDDEGNKPPVKPETPEKIKEEK